MPAPSQREESPVLQNQSGKQSDALFATFAQAMPHHVWTATPDGKLDWFNQKVYEYSGASVGELDGDLWASIVHPEDLPTAAANWASALRVGTPYESQFRILRHDGIYRWHLVRALPLKNDHLEIYRWIGTNTDIEDQKNAADALESLNANLERQVTERTRELSRTWVVNPEILGILNRDGYFEKSNPAWQSTLGWSEEEVRATKFFEFIHPDDLARTNAAWDNAGRGVPALRFENRYRCKDGGWRWLSWIAVPEGDKVYCSARDITAEKQQAAALVVTTADRERMWQLSPDLMLVADFASNMIAINPAWTSVMGWNSEELIGKQFLNFVHPDDLPATLSEMNKLSEGVTTFRFENRCKCKDGRYRVIAWTAVPDGKLIHGIGRDVTNEKTAQAQLAATEDALRQAQKMEAVGQLTGGIAHDFNNLLQSIVGSMELVRKLIQSGRIAETEKFIGTAMSSSQRAAALTHRLLAFSRRQPLDPKPVDLNSLIEGMQELIRGTVGPNIAVTVVGAADLWSSLVDPNQLENTLLNLCINARDAMPDGGRITIETLNQWLDERAARECELMPGPYVTLCVTDNGMGMSHEVANRAFDPFFTTKPLGAGTGLGLSMIYGFARQSGGQVRIYSEIGKGTKMSLYLPRFVGEASDSEEPLVAFEPLQAGHGKTVLIVDDESPVRMLVSEVAKESGYTVLEAVDGQLGLRILQSNAQVDLLITDVGLPGGINGRQMADAARLSRPGLKVLFITGYAENAVVGNGQLETGMCILTKPFTMNALGAKISEMMQRQS